MKDYIPPCPKCKSKNAKLDNLVTGVMINNTRISPPDEVIELFKCNNCDIKYHKYGVLK